MGITAGTVLIIVGTVLVAVGKAMNGESDNQDFRLGR